MPYVYIYMCVSMFVRMYECMWVSFRGFLVENSNKNESRLAHIKKDNMWQKKVSSCES